MGGIDMWHVTGEKKSNLSAFDWSKTGDAPQRAIAKSSALTGIDTSGSLFDQVCELNGFSSSLPALLHENLKFGSSVGQLDDNGADMDNADEVLGLLDEEMVSHAIGDLLPGDEEELLAGITVGFDLMNINGTAEENEEFDLFSSGGGLEMDGEPQEGFGPHMNSSRGLDGLGLDGFYNGGSNFYGAPSSNGPGSVIGEHPYGEHPSRTLFVRNINSNVEDSELRALFEQYGDIRTLYTACKHRGFVMISYYDIRAARTAMRNLQGKPLRRRKLDIHFSIPKDNPSDKDINQGTLVVFNLDPSVSNDDLRQIFGHYGEVKEIRETPHKRHHKFIEFYDVRAAEAALRALNRSDIAGKRIKLEPSRPGGARRSLMQQLSQDPDQDDNRYLRQQSSPPVTNSPPGHVSSWANFGSPIENGPHRLLHHSFGTSVPNMTRTLPGLPIPTPLNHMRVGTIGSHVGRSSQMDAGLSAGLGLQGLPSHHSHSLPEQSNGGMPLYSTANPMVIRSMPHGPLDSEGVRLPRSSSSDVSLFENANGALGMPGTRSLRRLNSASAGTSSLSGPQFLWGNTSSYKQNSLPPTWSNPPPVGHNLNSIGHQPFGYTGNHAHISSSCLPLHRHHVGSAPSGDPSFLERQFAYLRESPDTSFFHPGSASAVNVLGGSAMMSMGGSHGLNAGSLGTNGFFEGSSSASLGIISPRRRGHMFPTSGMMMGGGYFDMLGSDRGRIRRTESTASQTDNKKQYQLDIDRIVRGEDVRTTLMIKNIPNKYTSKMLLAAIDEHHRGMYDFLYLPIDFKNKCNVGYAFINMTSPNRIISIYQAFNGKKWEKFNSEKVASLAYARIQGKAALVAHFQNSSLMNEDKRCRPILFNTDGPENGDQELSVLEVSKHLALNREPMDNAEFMDTFSTVGNQDGLASGSVMGSSSLEKE